ncbi:MAG: AAA family ATPase, partial [Hyphomicrobium sp.]
MHISKLQLVNYRNFESANILFNKGINTIIGENGSGKTNLFRAIRLLLDDNMLRAAHRLDEKDFHRGLADWRGHWIIISLEFDEVSQDEAIQSLFLHGAGNIEDGAIGRATYNLIFRPKASIRTQFSQLADGDKEGLAAIRKVLTTDDYETIFTGKSSADFTDPAVYKTLAGDFDSVKFTEELEFPIIGGKIPVILSIAKEISLAAANAKAIAYRAGDKAKGFQPITDFIGDLAKETIERVATINELAILLYKVTVNEFRIAVSYNKFDEVTKKAGSAQYADSIQAPLGNAKIIMQDYNRQFKRDVSSLMGQLEAVMHHAQ